MCTHDEYNGAGYVSERHLEAFFHGPSDPSWTYDSYIPIATVGSVDDYWKLHNTIETTLSDGMYFVMREHVFHVGTINTTSTVETFPSGIARRY
jgi:hypothetical protein